MAKKTKNKIILTICNQVESSNQIKLKNNNLYYLIEDKKPLKIQILNISNIIIIGNFTLSTPLLKKLSQNNINIYLTDTNFKLITEINSISKYENHTTIKQIKINSSTNDKLLFSKIIIKDKITNQINLLSNKKLLSTQELDKIRTDAKSKINYCRNIEELMGIEGSLAKSYFKLIYSNFDWLKREHRKKKDITNYLLDIGYTYLYNSVSTLTQLNNLMPRFGFLHSNFHLRNSLSCDIMEPFRYIIDKEVINFYTRKLIKKDQFIIIDGKTKIKNYKDLKPFLDAFMRSMIQNQDLINKYIINLKQKIKEYDFDNI